MLNPWRVLRALPGRQLCSSYVQTSVKRNFQISRWQTCRSEFSSAPAVLTVGSAARAQAETARARRKDVTPTADTIYALSTAPGRAAIAVIRISGPACLDVYGALCPSKPFPSPRRATVRRLFDPDDDTRTLDTTALVLYFPAPKTVTGEDVLELHVHGGPAIVRSILHAIPRCTNARPRRRTAEFSHIRAAEPGEFTKRAFYNGRLDLTQAEALGETLAAETEQQRRLAIAGADSGLAARYESWRQKLLYARGELEALIDFSEDQHFDESPVEFMLSISTQVQELSHHIQLHIQNASRGELLRDGISVALLGAPNAGKSSLLNRIAGREAAIVSTEAGTTRDIVDVTVDIGGWLVRLGDMAGLRAHGEDFRKLQPEAGMSTTAVGLVEREGIRRARERALQSDLVIVLVSVVARDDGEVELAVNPELLEAVEECHKVGKAIVFAANKVDLLPAENRLHAESGLRQSMMSIFPSAHTGNVFLVSCLEAFETVEPVSSSSPTPVPTHSTTSPRLSDPGGVQTFLTGLLHTFSTMTSAATESDPTPSAINPAVSPAEASAYWAASLSVTHRQRMYLQQCLAHLDDFLAQCTPRGDSAAVASHHVDGHDDLVGEKVPGAEQWPDPVGVEGHYDVVTAAEHLRYAAICLARLTGRGGDGGGGDVEDVLGVVFEK